MGNYRTDFGSIHQFKKGGVTVIDDQAKKYIFSNMFEVAAKSKPYERTAVAKNFEYVIEFGSGRRNVGLVYDCA